jgi:hypothetical protein
MSPPFVSAIQFSAPHLRFESARTLNLVSKGSLLLTDIFETDQGCMTGLEMPGVDESSVDARVEAMC